MSSAHGIMVRSFQEADRKAMLELASRLTEGIAPWIDKGSMASAAQTWVEESIAAIGAEATVLVATGRDSGCAGFVTASCRTHFTGVRQAYVGELVVARDVEGRGIGRMLMDEVERWALEQDCRQVTLETGAGNQPARSFYGSLGYQDESVTLTKLLG